MAKQVYTTEEIEFMDGTVAVLKPLPILKLRRFMKELERLDNVKDYDENLDVLVDLTKLCLSHIDTVKDKSEEWYEETLDMETMFKVIEICGGIKLNDPKLLEVAQQMQAAQTAASAGTT